MQYKEVTDFHTNCIQIINTHHFDNVGLYKEQLILDTKVPTIENLCKTHICNYNGFTFCDLLKLLQLSVNNQHCIVSDVDDNHYQKQDNKIIMTKTFIGFWRKVITFWKYQ